MTVDTLDIAYIHRVYEIRKNSHITTCFFTKWQLTGINEYFDQTTILLLLTTNQTIRTEN